MSSFLVDSNIFVYALDSGNPYCTKALHVLEQAGKSSQRWCLSWQNVFEYLSVSTNPTAMAGRSVPFSAAVENISNILTAPNLFMLVEQGGFWDVFQETMIFARGAFGASLYDCRLAALMKQHGIKRIITADDGFARFPFLKVENPLKGPIVF